MMLNPKTLDAMRVLEERVLNSLLAERHGRVEDPNYAAANEYADEGISLAARDLVDAINAGHPQEWPVGWFCGEVGTGFPGPGPGPVFTQPCRLRPEHDEPHDWARREAAQEAEAELLAMIRRHGELCALGAVQLAKGDTAGAGATEVEAAGLADQIEERLTRVRTGESVNAR